MGVSAARCWNILVAKLASLANAIYGCLRNTLTETYKPNQKFILDFYS